MNTFSNYLHSLFPDTRRKIKKPPNEDFRVYRQYSFSAAINGQDIQLVFDRFDADISAQLNVELEGIAKDTLSTQMKLERARGELSKLTEEKSSLCEKEKQMKTHQKSAELSQLEEDISDLEEDLKYQIGQLNSAETKQHGLVNRLSNKSLLDTKIPTLGVALMTLSFDAPFSWVALKGPLGGFPILAITGAVILGVLLSLTGHMAGECLSEKDSKKPIV